MLTLYYCGESTPPVPSLPTLHLLGSQKGAIAFFHAPPIIRYGCILFPLLMCCALK
jgi:hypothetical protein